MMINPIIHRVLSRDDLLRLIAEIARDNPEQAEPAVMALDAGHVDTVLDNPAALDAVRGQGGAPAPLPLTLLWYVPIRAALRQRGEQDIALADFTASVPVIFASTRLTHRHGGAQGLADWWRSISELPSGSRAQAERAAYRGCAALWWAGCFPEWVSRKANGRSMINAYVGFAADALALASRLVGDKGQLAELYLQAAEKSELIWASMEETRRAYLGPDAHSAQGRLNRFLDSLGHSDN